MSTTRVLNDQYKYSYMTLPTGWGCECPTNTAIESKEECLAAARDVLLAASLNDDGDSKPSQLEEINVQQNTWKYGPCGCFIWKGGRKVFYRYQDDESSIQKDDFHCTAVQWAELICRIGEGTQEPIMAKDIAKFGEPYEWTPNPEDSSWKCLDWVGKHRQLHLKHNRDLCIGYEKVDVPYDDQTKTEVPSRRAILRKCNILEGTDAYLHYSYRHDLMEIKEAGKSCLRSKGREIGSPVMFDDCTGHKNEPDEILRWMFDSYGRFQNIMNGGYIGVEGCDIVENAPIVVMNLSSVEEGCDLTQWLPYNEFTDDVPVGSIWTTVVAIYGPLLISILCIIIAGIIQCKRQHTTSASSRRMRRPGEDDHIWNRTTYPSTTALEHYNTRALQH